MHFDPKDFVGIPGVSIVFADTGAVVWSYRLKEDSVVNFKTPKDEKALAKIYSILKSDGLFIGTLYSKAKRSPSIQRLNSYFKKKNYTVESVKHFLTSCGNEHYLKHDKNVYEVADTWLNPYYVDYTEESAKELFESNGFCPINISTAKYANFTVKKHESIKRNKEMA